VHSIVHVHWHWPGHRPHSQHRPCQQLLYLPIFHPMAQCVVHALKGLACPHESLRLARLPRTASNCRANEHADSDIIGYGWHERSMAQAA
jgi:hypothetical protein